MSAPRRFLHILPTALLLLLLLLPSAPGGQAQAGDVLYDFALEGPPGPFELVMNGASGQYHLALTFRDLSRDAPAGLVPGSTDASVFAHRAYFTATSEFEDDTGWAVSPISPETTSAGQTREVLATVNVESLARNPYFKLNVTARVETDQGTETRSFHALFFTKGIPGFTVQNIRSLEMQPREVKHTTMELFNGGEFPRSFEVEVIDNPCNLYVAAPPTIVAGGRSAAPVSLTVQGPEEKFWYYYESCSIALDFRSIDNPGIHVTRVVSVDVNGFYVDPALVFWSVFILLALLLLILFLKRRKERLEEEILGKPQKPWHIPAEKVYLDHLKGKDARAHYVVRHYLMEDEYRSSMLWYHAYKKATKGQRSKERLVLRHEKEHERWRATWQRRVAQPLAAADRRDARAQRQLDRLSRRRHRKQVRKWGRLVRKVEAAHAKQAARAQGKWEKAAAKAARKGREEPPRPHVAKPAVPPRPEPQPIAMESHRLGRKAERHRRRMVRRQGDLEVRFERAEARRTQRVRRKVQRIARRLDDPEFVKEHPLLQG